jgi:hypothetical protein
MPTGGRPVALLVLAHLLAGLTIIAILATAVEGFMAGDSLLNDLPFLLLLVVTLAVGWLLAVRLPRNPVGWILLAIPALFTLSAPLNLLETAVQSSAPGIARWIDWFNGTDTQASWSWLPPVWLLLVQLPLRFPDGRLPSPRWRWFSWLTVVALAMTCAYIGTAQRNVQPGEPNPAYMAAVARTAALLPVCFGLLALCFVVSIASLLVRYRRASARERAQLRWVMWAAALAVAGLIVYNLTPGGLAAVQSSGLLLYALVPITIAVAVLRYRLYEIDRIISRTAAYAIVTLLVIGTYTLVVLVVSLLLPDLPSVGVALATLVAAAVCLPLLRWIRRIIDRVFNRSQYDAERVADAFGRRIRNGADPQTAGTDLIGAVGQTLQPSAIGLWVPEDTT